MRRKLKNAAEVRQRSETIAHVEATVSSVMQRILEKNVTVMLDSLQDETLQEAYLQVREAGGTKITLYETSVDAAKNEAEKVLLEALGSKALGRDVADSIEWLAECPAAPEPAAIKTACLVFDEKRQRLKRVVAEIIPGERSSRRYLEKQQELAGCFPVSAALLVRFPYQETLVLTVGQSVTVENPCWLISTGLHNGEFIGLVNPQTKTLHFGLRGSMDQNPQDTTVALALHLGEIEMNIYDVIHLRAGTELVVGIGEELEGTLRLGRNIWAKVRVRCFGENISLFVIEAGNLGEKDSIT